VLGRQSNTTTTVLISSKGTEPPGDVAVFFMVADVQLNSFVRTSASASPVKSPTSVEVITVDLVPGILASATIPDSEIGT
jgi:hypothetical protein